MNRRKGFTLVEILVVITIITLLVSFLVVMIANIMEKARYAKTAALIKMLDDGCRTYNLDFGQYPPNSKQDSRSLHHHLGMERRIATQKSDVGGTLVSKKPPIIEFKLDMLADTKGGLPDPKTNPTPIVDAFDNPIRYVVPGKWNKKSVDIWSPGKDGKDQLDQSLPDYDDVTNWQKEF